MEAFIIGLYFADIFFIVTIVLVMILNSNEVMFLINNNFIIIIDKPGQNIFKGMPTKIVTKVQNRICNSIIPLPLPLLLIFHYSIIIYKQSAVALPHNILNKVTVELYPNYQSMTPKVSPRLLKPGQ